MMLDTVNVTKDLPHWGKTVFLAQSLKPTQLATAAHSYCGKVHHTLHLTPHEDSPATVHQYAFVHVEKAVQLQPRQNNRHHCQQAVQHSSCMLPYAVTAVAVQFCSTAVWKDMHVLVAYATHPKDM